MLAETAKLITELDLKDGLTPGLARAGGAVDAYSRKVGGLNVNWQKVQKGGTDFARGLVRVGAIAGGVAAVGIGAAAKAAADYEDAFAGVVKTVDAADLKKAGMTFASLRKDFLDMSTEIPISAVEFARLGETAGALGVKAKDIKEFSRVTALMGVTTNLSADAAADAFGRIGTILGLTGKQYRGLADTIVNLGNKGASTEADITETMKRFAAEAKAAGLSYKETAALASAVTSLGFAPERGGTAMGRVFANMATNISLANEKGKAFAKLVGEPVRELQRDIDKGRGLNIFMDVLKEIKGLTPTEANRTLKALGITNASDRTIFRSMADQLPFVNDQLKTAKDSTGALTEEANKKFDTLKSQFKLLKQNIFAAGVEVGDAFAPALKRAVARLTAFVKENKGQLRGLGVEIGQMLDRIDWNGVFSAIKTVASLFKVAYDVVRQIPPEVTAIGLGIVGLNKLSGGLLGSGISGIVGGLFGDITRGALSKVPGVGKFVAQPVFVTNWPMGGLGGPGGVVAGGAGGRGRSRLRAGAGLAGLGVMAGMALFGDDIEAGLGPQGGRVMGAAGNILTGAMFGPLGIAAAALLTAGAELKGAADDIGKAQASNREAAEGVRSNYMKAGDNLVNMTRLLKETTGFDRDLMKTFSSTELGTGLKNAAAAVTQTINNRGDQTRVLQQLLAAQQQAKDYGWGEVADSIGTQIEKVRRWMPKPETFASRIAQGAAHGVAAGIGKAGRERGSAFKDDKEDRQDIRKVIAHLRQVDSHKGNVRLFDRSSDRLANSIRRALGVTGKDRDRVIRDTIRDLRREQTRALNTGHTKLARNLGRDISIMQRVLGRKQDTTNTKLTTVANKDTSVSVTVPVTTTVSVRDVARTTTTAARYGMQAV